MPYSMSDPPAAIAKLPQHAKEIFIAAFNAAFDEYGEQRAFAIAWAAVTRHYEQDESGAWHRKPEGGKSMDDESITLDEAVEALKVGRVLSAATRNKLQAAL